MPDISKLPEHFWQKIDRSGGPEVCWPWLAATTEGYPVCSKGLVRRYLWKFLYGEISRGLRVCCQVDNILCVNPAHLKLRSAASRRDLALSRGTFYSPFINCTPEQYVEWQTRAKEVREARGHQHVITSEERAKGHKTRGCIPGGVTPKSSFNLPAVERRILLGDVCVFCHKTPTEIDHIRPYARGGSYKWDNRAPTCLHCAT